jgi:hypothetical protein
MRISHVLARTVIGRRRTAASVPAPRPVPILGACFGRGGDRRWEGGVWFVVVVVMVVGCGVSLGGVRRSAAGGNGDRPRREGEKFDEVVARRTAGRRVWVEDGDELGLGEAVSRGVTDASSSTVGVDVGLSTTGVGVGSVVFSGGGDGSQAE